MPNENSPPSSDSPAGADSQTDSGKTAESSENPLEVQHARRVARHQQTTVITVFSGPVPSPDILKAYNDIEPGLAREIIDWAKAEAQQTRDDEERRSKAATEIAIKQADADIEDMRREYTEARTGQFLGFVLGGGAIGGAIYLGANGAQTTACVMVGIGTASMIVAFLKGRSVPATAKLKSEPAQREAAEESI